MHTRRLATIGMAAVIFLISGCGGSIGSLFGPTPTQVVIYVTATPLPATPTDPPETMTALFGSSLMPTWTDLPTLTALPPSPRPPTLTPTFTPQFTDTPTQKPSTLSAQAAKACGSLSSNLSTNGFAAIFQHDPTLRTTLGCPQSSAIAIIGAIQPFERGQLLWASALADQPGAIVYALYADGTAQHFPDTWQQGIDPEVPPENAPANRFVPVRGFGKIWHDVSSVRSGLGWALAVETGSSAEIQRFTHGAMIFIGAANQTFIVIDTSTASSGSSGTWRADPTHF